ncbi:ribonuclease H-like domain-containing protein, partial [Melanogaster broomeanus]
LDSEAVRVQQEEIDRLKGRKNLTLLLDGWEDLLKRSLYGSVAVEVNQHPVVLSLEDMTGNRGNADNLVLVTQKAMTKMEIGDGKNIIAVTTDNPTVMQAYRRKLQALFPWILISSYFMYATFACFLHSLNTLIGEIVAYLLMKKVIAKTTRIVAFFMSSHYWGGQLNDEAKLQGIKQRLKQNCESRFYALILHCLSVLSHKNALFQVCLRPGAQQKTNNESPVAFDVIETILHDRFYWKRLEQLVKTTKSLVDAIGNVESRRASLADCMLELIRCAKHMSQLQLDPTDDDVGFWQHTKAVFNRRFHTTNTDYHSLALFLHPMCRKLAISQAASGRSVEHMVKIALGISMHWNWKQSKAVALISDIRTYNLGRAPFAGGQADGLVWWENLPVSAEAHPLKAFTITILSIVPHAGEVERLFSALGSTQSPRRCNLSVDTFETLRKVRANLNYHLHLKKTATGQQTQCQHAHMHTRDEPGINLALAKDLEDNFT